jgi:alpha-ketoglutarate-dependent taurine dioxygenase
MNCEPERALREELVARGYVVLPRLAVDVGIEAAAAYLGEPIAAWDGPIVHELAPRPAGAPNTYSGIFGLRPFPFHTDLAHWDVPPRYIVLRCVRGYADVPTQLIDGAAVVAKIGPIEMRRALMTPRRPRSGRIDMLRLSQREGFEDVLRWDEVFLKPASRVGQRVVERVRLCIADTEPTSITLVDRGDVAIIDNWRMLHARPAIAVNRRDRRLERVYLRGLA